ncbi:SRPBCC family protein [Streptomyces sp. NPDC001732]
MSQSAPELPRTVSETTRIAVPPAVVYEAVAEVTNMGRWSPECTGAEITGATGGGSGTAVGTRFTGRNQGAKGRPWSTACTVTAAVPGERFAFEVRAAGMLVAEWSYAFEPEENGASTRVTETWVDRRGRLITVASSLVTGVRDRATHNRESMKVTLQRLKKELEAEHEAA